jgi:excisionase family DNA binding protein
MAIEWIKPIDAAKATAIPLKQIYKLVALGQFAPAYRVGKLIRFDPNELQEWMQSKRINKKTA